jgi:hypothetical protein
MEQALQPEGKLETNQEEVDAALDSELPLQTNLQMVPSL